MNEPFPNFLIPVGWEKVDVIFFKFDTQEATVRNSLALQLSASLLYDIPDSSRFAGAIPLRDVWHGFCFMLWKR